MPKVGQLGQSGAALGQTHSRAPNSLPGRARGKWVTKSGETGPKREPAVRSKLVDSFVRYQEAKGIRSLRKVPYQLGVLSVFLEERDLRFADLTSFGAEEFQTYLTTLEDEEGVHYASGSVADIIAVCSMFYRYLAVEGVVLVNPFYGIKHIKREARLPRTIPTEAEMAEHLARLCRYDERPTVRERRSWYRLHVIAELLYATGMRVDELARLRVADFDFDAHTVKIRAGKGGVGRTAYLADYAVAVVRFYITYMREAVNFSHRGDNLFGVSSGRNFDSALNGPLKRICGFTSHSFRHAVGTHLLQRGCDLRYIQLILGHEDLKSTALYTRVSKEELRDQLDHYHPRHEV
jgi:site-specific recombinase XerD